MRFKSLQSDNLERVGHMTDDAFRILKETVIAGGRIELDVCGI